MSDVYVFTHDTRTRTQQLFRYPGQGEELEESIALLQETAPIMDYVWGDSLEFIKGRTLRLITLTAAALTDEQRRDLLNRLMPDLLLLRPDQRIILKRGTP